MSSEVLANRPTGPGFRSPAKERGGMTAQMGLLQRDTRRFPAYIFLFMVLAAAMTSAISARADEPLRMNEIQVIATHNSYHQRPSDAALSLATRVSDNAKAWDYSHAPLDVQLDRGVRSFELDIHYMKDGYGVFHVPHIDYGSTCPRLLECFSTVQAWSSAHPGHVPIIFLLENKNEGIALDPANILPIDAPGLDRLDEEIRSVFPPDQLITPDDVRGDSPTLEAAVLERGWPALDVVRGRVMIVLHERGATRDLYTAGRPSLEGRAMFVRSDEGRPDAAFLIVDYPRVEVIQRLVSKGYMVRTRADSSLRYGDTQRRDAAFASGAQVVSTDFPPGEAHEDTGYMVVFPSGPIRCNPVNAPGDCTPAALEPCPAE